MAQQKINDHSLLESLFEAFRNQGYEGTTLSQLSSLTGLKKSSLYHRFPKGKDDMTKAVVLYVSAKLHEHVIEPLLTSNVSPEIRFSKMIETINLFYCDGRKNCLLNVLSLGEAKTEIKALLNNDYTAWISALVKLGKDAGMCQQEAEDKSEHFLVVVQGALVIQRLTTKPLTFLKHLQFEQTNFFRLIHS